VRRTVRPSAKRDQRDQREDEPGAAAQSQDDGSESQCTPARELDCQQEALPGIPVDDGGRERNGRDRGTHPDQAENADTGGPSFSANYTERDEEAQSAV
jgi:hypothetical protein